MFRRTRALLATLLLAMAIPAAAMADPVNWTLNGVTLSSGTASGSFTYDSDTDTFSNINIVTTAGTLPGATYTQRGGAYNDSTGGLRIGALTAAGNGGNSALALQVTTAMTNAGGTITIVTGLAASAEYTCGGGTCSVSAPFRAITGGSIVGVPVAPVPTMSEWAMILFGLMLASGAALYIQRRQLIA